MNAARSAFALSVAIVALSTPTQAQSPSTADVVRGGLDPSVLVTEVSLGMAGSIADQGPQVIESTAGAPLGVMAAFTAGIRTIYFVTPAVDIAYYGLGGSTDRVMTPAGEEAVVDNRLELVTLSFGLLVDLWRFRIRAGTGMFNLRLDTRTGGVQAQTSRLDFGYLLGITAHFYRHEGRQLGLEGRVAIDAGSDTVVLTLGLVATLDALKW